MSKGLKRMQNKAAVAVMTALLLASCAAMTPAPRFSAVSPADRDGPEAGTPPPVPALAGEPEAQAPAQPGATPPPAAGHAGHAMPAAATRGHEGHSPTAPAAPGDPGGQLYTCPMHPEVKQASPGSCPKCGMPLVRRDHAGVQP